MNIVATNCLGFGQNETNVSTFNYAVRLLELPQDLFIRVVGLLLEATATRNPKRTPDSNEGGRKGPRH